MTHYNEVLDWMKKYQGKPIDEDGLWGAQCVDLVNNYAREVHGEKYSRGNGLDKAHNFARDYGWKFIGPKEKAQAGDVISWGKSWGRGYGHTAVVLEDHGTYIRGFDQNPGAPRIRDILKKDVVGYARPTRYVQAAPKPKPEPKPSGGTYTVKNGDTLWAIAKAHNMSLDALCKLNGIPSSKVIHTGDVLKVAAQSKTHVVLAGENLSRIAAKYGTTVSKIVSLNNIPNPNVITVGQRLRVA